MLDEDDLGVEESPATSSRNTADKLLSTAAGLFRRKGYARSTTRELSELLGIRKASLYYHVSSKEAILREICLESLRRLTPEIEAVARTEPPATRLSATIRTHVTVVMRDRDMHATMLTELRALSPESLAEVIQQRDNYQRLLQDIISADQSAGRLRIDIDAKYLTLGLLNLLNWTIFWFDPAGELAPEELGGLLADIFIDGAHSKKTRGSADSAYWGVQPAPIYGDG